MIRLYTYLTLVAGLPTVAGTYFDPTFAELDVDLANNKQVQIARNGMPLIVSDAQLEYPIAASLTVLSNYVDLKSEIQYLGSTRYLAPALYIHWLNKIPICIFTQNIEGQAKKCLLCYFAPGGFDKVLAAQVTTITNQRTHLARINPVKAFTFSFVVMLDGEFSDYDDITSASWFTRF